MWYLSLCDELQLMYSPEVSHHLLFIHRMTFSMRGVGGQVWEWFEQSAKAASLYPRGLPLFFHLNREHFHFCDSHATVGHAEESLWKVLDVRCQSYRHCCCYNGGCSHGDTCANRCLWEFSISNVCLRYKAVCTHASDTLSSSLAFVV